LDAQHSWSGGYDIGIGRSGLELLLKVFYLVPELLFLKNILNRQQELFFFKGLDQIIRGAELHDVHYAAGLAHSGKNNDGYRQIPSLEKRQYILAGRPWQEQVERDHVWMRTVRKQGDRLVGRSGTLHFKITRGEKSGQIRSRTFIVIDHH